MRRKEAEQQALQEGKQVPKLDLLALHQDLGLIVVKHSGN